MSGPGVFELKHFYDTTLGQVARRAIRRRILTLWPNVQDMTLVGLGYATPYLRMFRDHARCTVAAMPDHQGGVPWPPDGPNVTVMTREDTLPFEDCSVDRVLMVHSLETAQSLRPLLREVWRILVGQGRLLLVIPNRRSPWVRAEKTPFASGQPYSKRQIITLLKDNLFLPERVDTALYFPPMTSSLLLRSAHVWETVGRHWFTGFAGVMLVDVTKQVFIPNVVSGGAVAPARRFVMPVPAGLQHDQTPQRQALRTTDPETLSAV